MRTCKQCGNEIPIDAHKGQKHCLTCRPPEPKKLCPDCGEKEIQLGSQRCLSCSAKEAQNRPEVKEKMSGALKVSHAKPEVKARRSKIMKEVQNRPEVKAQKSKMLKIAFARPEIREKMSRVAKEAQNRPETKKRKSKALKAAWAGGLFIGVHDGMFTDEVRRKLSSKKKAYLALHPEARWGENNPNWRGGLASNLYGYEFNEELKERIRQRQDRKCFICQLPERIHRVLSVHHVDYDKTNNDPSNLVALCTGCHLTTNGKRDYWQHTLSDLISKREDFIARSWTMGALF